MAKGWVKIWRKIWASDIWDDEEPFCKRAAWIDLILMANHEPHEIVIDGKPVTIERGQLHTSERKLAKRWHWSRDKVRRFLATTFRTTMLTTNRTTNGTTITIENYSVYQGALEADNTTGNTTHDTRSKTQTRRKEYIPGRAKGAPGPLRAPDPPMEEPDVIDW